MLCSRGILFGPWLPIYGIGAIGIYILKNCSRYQETISYELVAGDRLAIGDALKRLR
ncbi:MAG: hypothetical protein Q4F41_12990 [Eubacteriales bacterium]|nr:hypothetical protein [Eubacteriales bacterium]